MPAHFSTDPNRDWSAAATPAADAAALESVRLSRKWGTLFVPDVRSHTANLAEATFLGGELARADGFVPAAPGLPDTLVRPATDAVLLWGFPPAGATVIMRPADCGVVALYCRGQVAGMLHAGWRGLAAGVVARTLGRVRAIAGPDVFAATRYHVAPMAGEGYEFGVGDFREKVEPFCRGLGLDPAEFLVPAAGRPGVYHLRLRALLLAALDRAGARDVTDASRGPADRANDTLDPGSAWPSHRLFSQDVARKAGRFAVTLTAWPEPEYASVPPASAE